MNYLTLQITGKVALGGRKPGETFRVKCDEEGQPLEVYWRRRLADARANPEANHLTIVMPDQPAPAPKSAALSPKKSATPSDTPTEAKE
jgi:hypothetical protein